jgi:integrase
MRIEKFLDIYPKKTTQGVYRAGVYNFIDCLYGKVRKGKQVTKDEKKVYETFAERYFTEGRDYFEDLLTFAAYMHGSAPTGARAKIAGVVEFLSYYDVELTQKQRKQLSTKLPKGKTSRTAEKDIDTETLKKILTHLDLKGKAVTLTLASSGMRIGELFQVKLPDVDLTTTPPEIVVRGEGTKSGDTRTVFISSEAKEVLLEWLKVRDQYLNSAKDKNRGLVAKGIGKEKTVEDDRLFPFTDVNFREGWESALRKAGLWNKDNTTGRSQTRIHALRKFFRSQLALSCPLDIVEALMGHEGYLTEAYRRYTRKQMGEYYLKAEHQITVAGTADLYEIKDRLQDTQAAVKGYKDIITEQAEEMVEMRRKVEAQGEEIEAMKAREDEIIAKEEETKKIWVKIEELEKKFAPLVEDEEVRELVVKKRTQKIIAGEEGK